MLLIIISFYLLVILIYVIASLFIVYHLDKYSINTRVNVIMLPLFIIVSMILLISNLLLFFSVKWSFLINYFNF
jgi:hypothetical protein